LFFPHPFIVCDSPVFVNFFSFFSFACSYLFRHTSEYANDVSATCTAQTSAGVELVLIFFVVTSFATMECVHAFSIMFLAGFRGWFLLSDMFNVIYQAELVNNVKISESLCLCVGRGRGKEKEGGREKQQRDREVMLFSIALTWESSFFKINK
jgi:hypothetical protein